MANTDPFDFISTRTEPKSVLTDVRDTLSLMPLVDADYRVGGVDSNGAVSNTTNPLSLFDTIAQNISKLPDNAPAYQYTTQQEKRYSNPNLQFTPTNILGTDTEDIYGRYQSAWDQLGNAVVKFGANTVGTFASSYLSTPATLDLIRSGKYVDAFAEDHPFAGVQNWLTALEDKYPNYYTEWERDHPYLSAITPTGAANFWGDKVVKNIGFSIGGLAAGLVQDSLIELATAGTATPTTFIAAANQLNKFRSNLFRGFRNLTKGADKIDDIIDASRVTGNLAKGLQVSKLSQVGTGARFAGISYLNAQGESFIEGYHTYIDTKKQLLEEAIQSGDTSPENLSKIEQLSQDAGRYTTGINLPILTLSNWFQFSNLLYGKAMLGEAIGKQFVKTELTDTGIKYVSDFTLKKGLKQWAIETLKDSASEGFEEGAQYHVSNSLHDYYVDRMNPTIKEGLMGHLLSSVPKSLTDKQFWEESFLGALTGTLMGSYTGISKVTGGKARYENLVNTLNKDGGPLQRFNSTVSQFSKAIDLSNPNADKEVTKHDALFGTVHDSLKFGTFDTFLDALEDTKSLEVQDYNTKFQTEFETKIEKDLHVQDMIEESYQMKEDVLKVNRAFPKNPYSSNKLTQKIKRAFSNKSSAELDAIQGYLFNDFKEVLARNESLLRKTNGRVLQHKDNLKSLGVKSETIDYMMNLGRSPKGLDSYLKFKKAQLKDLERNVKYYESLGRADNSLTPEVNISEELKNAKQLLDETTQYFERIQELHQQLKTDPKNKTIQDTVRSEVLWEETSEDQRSRYVAERTQAQEELEKEGEKEDTLIIENDDLHKAEESKTAEQLVDLKQQEEELSEVLPEVTPVPEPIIPANKWLDKFEQGKRVQIKGKWYNIIGKTDDALIIKDVEFNIDYEATKDKQGRWKLTGIGLNSVIDEELNVIQPSEPVQKVEDTNKYGLVTERIKKLPFEDRVKAMQEAGILDEVIFINGTRPIVIANFGGILQPFYRSSKGTGGKTAGKWFPMFGFGKHNEKGEIEWLIKPTIADLENNLNHPLIEAYSKTINYLLDWDASLDLDPVYNPNSYIKNTHKGDEQKFNLYVYGRKDLGVINDGEGSAQDHIISVINSYESVKSKFQSESTAVEQVEEQDKIQEIQKIERRRKEELDKLGQKQLVKGFKDLSEATKPEQIANAIVSIEKNTKQGVKLSKEQEQQLSEAKTNLKEQGYEIIDYKMVREGENTIVQNVDYYDNERDVLTEDQAYLLESRINTLEKRGEEIYIDDLPSPISRTIKPLIKKDGKMVQAAEVNILIFENIEQAKEAVKKSKEAGYKKPNASDKVNAKYDAEIEALKSTAIEQQQPVTTEEVVSQEYEYKLVERGNEQDPALKGKDYQVQYIDPKEYISMTGGYQSTTIERKKVLNIIDKIKRGVPLDPITIEVDSSGNYWGQEGRHRAEACIELGIKEIPIVYINKKEELDEYLSQPIEEAEVITEVTPTLTISQEEFTRDEIVNYPNTIWIKSDHSLENRIPVYSIEATGVVKRNIVTGAGVLPKVGEASKSFNGKLPNYKFKQVLRPDEEVVIRETPKSDNKNLDKFLGKYSSMKEIFQQQIDNNKFELIC